jgi:nitrite reductase/ring-hydroxylating ferredoxin subunit
LFRGDDGKAGVLDAFCPHMSTHLGYGGFVQGNSIVCPYHEWQFGTDGKLVKMPFGGRATAEHGAASCNAKAYPVIERFGMIFTWFHADDGEPYELDLLDLVAEKRLSPVGRIVDDDFMMHCMEPSHNSADWYHFKTVHSRLGQHWLVKWSLLHAEHILLPARMALDGSIDDDGQPITKKQLLVVDEKLKSLSLFGMIPIPGAPNFSHSQVRFNGPMGSAFCVRMRGLGQIMLFMNLTPVEPFRTHTEYFLFTDWWIPQPLAYVLSYLIIRTTNQDREVWEHRGHPDPRNPVKGDYDYKRYDSWLQQFYSKSSTTWETAYEDLTF